MTTLLWMSAVVVLGCALLLALLALIGGTPEVRREGHGIVNRIIPFGNDIITVTDDPAEEARTR